MGQNDEELLHVPIEKDPKSQAPNINVQNVEDSEIWHSNLFGAWMLGFKVWARRLPLLLPAVA
jgi:hypothetical protein